MTDFVEYIPKRHGQRPPYWTPDTLTGLDGKNYVRQPNWAWIAGTTYYVPYEAVHGRPRPAPVDADADADAGPVDDYQRGVLNERAKIVAWLRVKEHEAGKHPLGVPEGDEWAYAGDWADAIEAGEHAAQETGQ